MQTGGWINFHFIINLNMPHMCLVYFQWFYVTFGINVTACYYLFWPLVIKLPELNLNLWTYKRELFSFCFKAFKIITSN